MRVCSFMRSANGLTLYAEDGEYKNLDKNHYRIGAIIAALDELVANGQPVDIDLSGFRIENAVAAVSPDARLIKPAASSAESFDISWPDLGFTIKGGERLVSHFRGAMGSAQAMAALRAFLAKSAALNRAHSTDELLDFLVANGIPLAAHGDVLAFKYVLRATPGSMTDNGMPVSHIDLHSRTFDNSPGALPRMPAEHVRTDRTVACAPGLHVGAYAYASSHASAKCDVMAVLAPPRAFLSVPHDYNHQKARTSGYLVLGPVSQPPTLDELALYARVPVTIAPDGASVEILAEPDAETLPIVENIAARSPISAGLALLEAARRACRSSSAPSPQRMKASATPGAKTSASPGAKATAKTTAKATAKATAKTPAKTTTQTTAGALWRDIASLAAETAYTAAGIRSLMTRRQWPRRLNADGLIEVRPDKAFVADHLRGWELAAVLAAARKVSVQKLAHIAKKEGWGWRRTPKGLEYKPA